MNCRLLSAIAALTLVPSTSACAASRQGASVPATLQWRILAGDHDHGKVQLELSYHTANSRSVYGRSIALAELEGLEGARLNAGAQTAVRFSLVRDAGSFDCDGTVSRGAGGGSCRFAPGRAFAAELSQQGYGTPDDSQLFNLAMSDIGSAYVAEVARQGYTRPDLAELLAAGDHGISLEYLTGMGALGYRVGTLAALVQMRDHGVGPDYIRSVVAAGLTDLPPETLVEMRDHGVSADYIGALRRLGYRAEGVDRLIALRDHGVTAGYVEQLRAAGYTSFGTDDLIRLRDNGVSAEFARRVGTGGTLSAEELIRLRNGG